MIKTLKLLALMVLFPFAMSAQPFTESFESGKIPSTWKVINNNNDSGIWQVSGYAKKVGNYGIRLKCKWNETYDDYIISPKFTVSANDILSFYAKSRSTENPGAFKVLVSKNQRIIDDLIVEIDDISKVTEFQGYKKYEYKLIDNPQISAGDEICFAIYVDSRNKAWLDFDHFSVGVPATTPVPSVNNTECIMEAQIGLSMVSDQFRITNKGIGNLVISEVTDLSGTAFSTTLTSAATASLNLGEYQSYNFTFGFNPTEAKTYTKDFVIETNAGDITIKLTGNGIPKIEAVTSINEGFEGDDIPQNWTVIDGNNSGKTWQIKTGESNSGDNSIEIKRSESGKNNDWLITPLVKVKHGAKMSFYAKSSFYTNEESMEVLISKTGLNTATDFTKNVISVDRVPAKKYAKYEFMLTDIPGINYNNEVFIAIRSVSNKGNYSLFVDDFTINQPEDVALNKSEWAITTEVNKSIESGDIFTIGNNTDNSITINKISDISPFTTTLTEGITLDAGEFKTFAVTYNPTDVNIHNREMTITTSAGSSTLYLKGVSKAPQVASVKISYDFEDSELPENWFIYNENNDELTWRQKKLPMAHSGQNVLVIQQHKTNIHNDWIVFPLFKVTEGAHFRAYVSGFTDNSQVINIKLSKTGNKPEDFTVNLVSDYVVQEGWAELDIDLTAAYKGISIDDEIYIAIQAVCTPQTSIMPTFLLIDDILIGKPDLMSNGNLITKFNLEGQVGESVINSEDNTVNVIMPYSVDLSRITPEIEISDYATITPDPMVPRDFSEDVVFTVTAENGTERVWTIHTEKEKPEGDNKIVTFTIPNQIGETVISHSSKTVKITIPESTDLTSITPQIEVSTGATVNPGSGKTTDFSGGNVQYTVTSSSGKEAIYTVKLTTIKEGENKMLKFTINGQIGDTEISHQSKNVTLTVSKQMDISNITPQIEISENATVSPGINESVDFSKGSVNYTVTSNTGKKAIYTVTVNRQKDMPSDIDDTLKNNIILYPNPCSDIVNIKGAAKCYVSIYSNSGKLVYRSYITEDNTNINCNQLNKGIYFVKIINSYSSITKKLIIK
jgi:hypothetical protein